MHRLFPSKENLIGIQLETIVKLPHVQGTLMTEQETIKALCSKREWEFLEAVAQGNWPHGKPWPKPRNVVSEVSLYLLKAVAPETRRKQMVR